MSSGLTFYLKNDNIVEITGLRFHNGDYVNGAMVEFTIYDSEDNVVFGRQMEYVQDSNGHYRTVIPYDIELNKKRYHATMDAFSNARRAHWEGTLIVRERSFRD